MPDPTPVNQFTEVAEIYDDLMSVVPYRWWVEYVQKLWQGIGVRPRRVLDLACGTGNVLAELLRRGYAAEGADYSEAMLRIAARKLPPEVRVWHQDARSLEIPGPPFDACVCLFDSLNYILELPDLRRACAGVYRHLAPGGCFIFDVNAIHALQSGMFDQSGTGQDERVEYDWESAWEPRERLCTIHMEFRARGPEGVRVFHETHQQRGYTIEELSGALKDAGFEVRAIYDAFTTRAPSARTDRLYFVATRPSGRGNVGT